MKVKFLPNNEEHEIKPGQSVMNVAHENGIHIQSVCKGIPSCAECRVQVIDGATNVLPPFAEELDLIGTAHFVDQRRLSCQLRCFGDVTVDLTEQVEKESVSTMQPKGRFKKEDGESVARLGNILEEEAKVDLDITEEEAQDVLKEAPLKIAKAKTEAALNKPNTGNKKKRPNRNNKNRNRNNNNNSNNNSNKKASSQNSSSGGGDEKAGEKKSKNKNRNRNRNRNRNKKKPDGGSNA